MAHRVYTRNLGRNKSWRKATVRSLAQAVVKEERIRTTRAKAKEAQRLVERLVTLGKKGNLAARRRALSMLNDSGLVHRLFSEVAPRFQSRAGGYTRILQQGFRPGDGASMAILELVELSPERVVAPKEKGKPRAEKPKAAAPPEAPPRKPEQKTPKQEVKEPRASPGEEEKPKPRGLIEGLRKFFKKGRKKP